MKRGTVGSILFVGATLVFLGGTSAASGAEERAEWPQNRRVSMVPAPVGMSAHGAGATTPSPKAAAKGLLGSPEILASAGLKAAATADLPGSANCPDNMVEVEGDYCPTLEQKCLRWVDPETTIPRRCAEFAPTGACQGKLTRKHFCIDRYEWPNRVGENPVVMKSWYEAGDACKSQGKRLCGDSEWTLACEGQERLPYPYGYERNSQACNIDKPHPDVNEKALADPKLRDAEVARLWQGETSGSRESCVSPYGAFDMTGNVDEWVVNEGGMPYKSGLKGGYWGPVRDRCRPMTTAHHEQFQFYQIGFRCCSDTPGTASAPIGVPAKTPGGINAGPSRSPSANPGPSGITGS